MSMLKTVLSNLCRPSRTRAPADMPPVPPAFRGALAHRSEVCTGCGTCAYVCSPKAIKLDEQAGVSISWNFFAGQCSFCGLCEKYCPTKAITFGSVMPDVTGDSSVHHLKSVIGYQACPRCGQHHVPMPGETAQTLPGGSAADAALCPDCRRQASSQRIRDGFIGKEHRK